MILAAPLVIPFAEAVGLSVATLGMAKVADMVNEYIQENPEQSMKILSTIVPGVGIGEIFMKKGKDEEVEEDIEVEDVDARDLTKKEKAKKMKELAKSGASREKMIKGYEEIILPGKEDEMLDEAEDRYEGGVEEVTRPKFDYKKFFKKRYADGGSIGIEVLFEPKRKDFNIGGNVQRVTTPQPYDARASAADFARAIDRVGAGTDMQKAMAIQDYGENVRRQNIMNKFVNQPSFLGPATQQAAKNLNQGVLASQSALDMLNKTMTPFEPTLDSDRILEIVEQQRAAGVPETGLITNFKPNMADVAGPSTATTNTAGVTQQDPFKLNQLQVSGAVTLDEALDYAKRRGDPQSYLDFITREYDLMQQTPIDYLVREEKYKDSPKSDITDELTRIYNQTSPEYRSADTLDKYISDYYKTNPYYADGGRVGLFMGGDPLTGQALAIYNSMNAYGFSDQEIANALEGQGLYTAPGSSTPETTTPNIIGSQINQGGGRDGIQSIGPQNIASFTETVEARQNRLNNPGKIADFINSNLSKIGINTQRSANEMLASGIKDTRATSGIPFGISGMIARALPNAYTDKLTLGEQVFSQENMGFTGEGNMANKDPFGINVVSAFGNYADYVKDRVAELEDIVADQKKRGLTDTYQMKELAFRSKQDIDRQNRISDAAKIQELQRIEKERIAKANTARQVVMEEARQRGDNPSAGSFSSNSPGGISQQTSRDARGGMSGWGLRDGGLATMFKEKR